MSGEVVDYGLVLRAECACGLVIIIPKTASDAVRSRTIRDHGATPEHRAYVRARLLADARADWTAAEERDPDDAGLAREAGNL